MQKKYISWLYFFFSLSVGFAIISILLYKVGYEKFSAIIIKTSPTLIAISIIIYSISWFFRTSRLKHLTLKKGYKIKSFDLFKLNVSGFALNTILPARLGDASMVGYLRMKGICLGESAAIIIQSRVLDLIAITVLVVITIPFISYQDMPSWAWKSIYFSILIAVAIYAIGFMDRQKRLSAIFEKFINKLKNPYMRLIFNKLKDAYDAYFNIASDRSLFFRTFFSSCIIWLIEGLTCFFVSMAVGIQITFISAIFAVSIANMGKAIPATLGGIGIYESILAAILVSLGISFDVAIVTAILDHFIKKAFTLGFGIPATLGLLRRGWGRKFGFLQTGQ